MTVILKTWTQTQKNTGPKRNPYDSENLDQESGSTSKDITQEDLIDNASSKGFETARDTQGSDNPKDTALQSTQPEKDHPVHKGIRNKGTRL